MAIIKPEKAALCDDCVELLCGKKPKALTRLTAVCNGCGRERYCVMTKTRYLSFRKDRLIKTKKKPH